MAKGDSQGMPGYNQMMGRMGYGGMGYGGMGFGGGRFGQPNYYGNYWARQNAPQPSAPSTGASSTGDTSTPYTASSGINNQPAAPTGLPQSYMNWYQPISSAYNQYLGRSGSPEEIFSQMGGGSLNSPQSVNWAIRNIINSPEAQQYRQNQGIGPSNMPAMRAYYGWNR